MAHTHEFDCKQCGAHFDSREELEQHNRANHRQGAQAARGDTSAGAQIPTPPSDQAGQRRA